MNRFVVVLTILAVFNLFFVSCKKNDPSGPSAPANNSTMAQTSTFTVTCTPTSTMNATQIAELQVTLTAIATTTVWMQLGSSYVNTSTYSAAFFNVESSNNIPHFFYSSIKKFYGGAWHYDIPQAVPYGTTAIFTSIAFYNDTPYVSYVPISGGSKMTVKKYNGSTWDTIGTASFTTGAATEGSLDVYNGIPFVAFSDGSYSGKLSVMKYNGTNWEYVGNPGLSSSSVRTAVIKVIGGNIYVGYTGLDSDNYPYVIKYNGASWEYVGGGAVSGTVVSCISSSMAVDTDGTIYMAYINRNPTNKIEVRRFNGTSWDSVGLPVSAGTGYVRLRVHNSVVFTSVDSTVYRFNGSIWESLGSPATGMVRESSFTIDQNGTPYLALMYDGVYDSGIGSYIYEMYVYKYYSTLLP